jgi:hypothetical protein
MTEIVDYKLLSVYIVFGILILFGYALIIQKKQSYEIWTNKGKNILSKKSVLKKIYIFMIFLSFIAGTYLVYYLSTSKNTDISEILIYVGSIVFLVCSTVWAFRPFEYSKIILGAVAIGSILILSGIVIDTNNVNNSKKALALTASSILVIQTVLFDFFIWTGLII